MKEKPPTPQELTPIRPLPKDLANGTANPYHDFGVGQPVDTAHEVELREYWKVILKYRALIGLCVAGVGALAVLFVFTVTPRYTASSRIRIGTYEPVLTATKVEDVFQEKSKESNYLETQIQEIKSYSLADLVLRDEKINSQLFGKKRSGWFSGLFGKRSQPPGHVPESIDDVSGYKSSINQIRGYLSLIDVAPIRRTSLVEIHATAESARLAAIIANKHALEYIEWVRETRVKQQSRALQFLEQQANELRERVAELEREIADYAEENSIVAVNSDENITAQRMAQLNKLLTSITAERIEAENEFLEAKSSLVRASAGYDDPSTQSMRSELGKLRAEHEQLLSKFTPEYPRMKQLKAQIEGLERAIGSQRQEIVEGLRSKADALGAEETRLKEELEKQKSRTFELAKRQVAYNILQREKESSRELLQNVLRQIKESSLAVEGKSSNVSVVDYAVIPSAPSYPRKGLFLLIGLLAGTGLGVGIAFLLNYLDNTVRTPEDLAQLVKLPNLGVVPSFTFQALLSGPAAANDAAPSSQALPEVVPNGAKPPIAFLDEPKSLAAEAYRTIRTGILLSQAGEPPRTVLITSAQSSEGKTTSVMNLAASLASAGGRVALIDADLRRPSLGRYFELPPQLPGVVEIITGQLSPAEVGLDELVKRVTLFPSGRIPPNPAELLGSVEMAAFLDELSTRFDYVLIDSPPILPVTDAVILSRYVDGVVMVVKGASTPKRVVLDAKSRLEGVGARLLGTILNDIDVKSGDYYYYNRYYSSYYREEPDLYSRQVKMP